MRVISYVQPTRGRRTLDDFGLLTSGGVNRERRRLIASACTTRNSNLELRNPEFSGDIAGGSGFCGNNALLIEGKALYRGKITLKIAN